MSVVLLDVDGVVASFTEAVLDLAQELTGVIRWPCDVTSWDLFGHLGLSAKDKARVYQGVAQPGFCESIPVMPGAVDFVHALAEKHDVVFVTSPWLSAPTWTFERHNWLRRHFGQAAERIIHTQYKQYVRGDVLVDDRASNVRSWQQANETGMGLLFNQPHNQAGSADLIRVSGYMDVISAIDELNSEVLRCRVA